MLFPASGECDADDFASDSDDDAPDIFLDTSGKTGADAGCGRKKRGSAETSRPPPFLDFTLHATQRPATHRYSSPSYSIH